MVKFAGFILLLFLAMNSFSQTNANQKGYSFVGLSDESKKEYYADIINKIDLEQYRLRTGIVTIKFRNGFSIELESAETLAASNKSIVPMNYVVMHGVDFQLPDFKITDDGTLVTLQRAKKTKSEIKYNSVK